MKIEYDNRADAVYLQIASTKSKVWKSKEVEPGVVIDLDNKKRVIGIEILDASKRMKPAELFEFSVKHIGAAI